MRQSLEEFLQDSSTTTKELARKLYWAISSTVPITAGQKRTAFIWAADMAERLVKRIEATPPPASRHLSPGKRLAMGKKNGYAALAGGGAAGSLDQTGGAAPNSSLQRPPPHLGSARNSRPPPPPRRPTPGEMERFKDDQARMKAAAIQYMVDGIKVGRN